MTTLYDFDAKRIDGEEQSFADFRGKVCLIVNVASECGLTPQYDGLTRLYKQYRDEGFEILAFPCNQFGEQEPGSEAEIDRFCRTQFGVEFPMFGKVDVNGLGRDPIYAWLTEAEAGPDGAGEIAWNFAKFLIDREGNIRARFGPPIEPCAKDVTLRIEEALAATPGSGRSRSESADAAREAAE
ncbi:MAG: glutathione peroxidase [Myxococcota bacterium]